MFLCLIRYSAAILAFESRSRGALSPPYSFPRTTLSSEALEVFELVVASEAGILS